MSYQGQGYSRVPPVAEPVRAYPVPVEPVVPAATAVCIGGGGVVVQQPGVAATTTVIATGCFRTFGPYPTMASCDNCGHTGMTVTESSPGTSAWVLAFVCCMLGLWLCCWIPFVSPSYQDHLHMCSRCQAPLGHYYAR
eukprot:scpid92560/ scgid34390/ 